MKGYASTGEVAQKSGYSARQIARMASEIPGHRLTPGGHHVFERGNSLHFWIEHHQVKLGERGRPGRKRKTPANHYNTQLNISNVGELRTEVEWFLGQCREAENFDQIAKPMVRFLEAFHQTAIKLIAQGNRRQRESIRKALVPLANLCTTIPDLREWK